MEPGATEPSLPAFPTPPPTKAEKTEQERERNEQEQDEDDAQLDQKAPGQDEGPFEGEAAQPENGPVAQAQDRGARDLQETDKPLDQEVGPDLATQDKERPEPETEKPDPEQEQAEDGVGDGGASRDDERPDAEDGQEEKDQLRERAAAESRTTATSPAMAGPAPTVTSPVAAAVSRPAGARTPKTPVEDRDPSPATRRDAEPPRSEREAPQAKSRVPKESGPGAAPRGPVGASEKTGPAVGAAPARRRPSPRRR